MCRRLSIAVAIIFICSSNAFLDYDEFFIAVLKEYVRRLKITLPKAALCFDEFGDRISNATRHKCTDEVNFLKAADCFFTIMDRNVIELYKCTAKKGISKKVLDDIMERVLKKVITGFTGNLALASRLKLSLGRP